MIGRAIWGTLLLAVAVAGTCGQLDREARRNPQIASLVPVVMRGFAAQSLAVRAIADKDAATANRESLRLIRTRPLPAENLSLLAAAAALNDNEKRAIAALEQASTRGWRDPVVQISVAQAALAQGDYEASAQRIAAMLATGTAREQALALFATLIKEPAGRTAFAAHLARAGRWQQDVPLAASAVAAPDDLAETISLAKAGGAEFGCEGLGQLAQIYRSKGHEDSAMKVECR